MTNVDPASKAAPPAIPLDYGVRDGAGSRWRSIVGGFYERLEGTILFFWMLLVLLGGIRQVLWAIGCALAAYGLGLSIHGEGGNGPRLLGWGVFLAASVVPAPGRAKR
jgi:hypothetical protein